MELNVSLSVRPNDDLQVLNDGSYDSYLSFEIVIETHIDQMNRSNVCFIKKMQLILWIIKANELAHWPSLHELAINLMEALIHP